MDLVLKNEQFRKELDVRPGAESERGRFSQVLDQNLAESSSERGRRKGGDVRSQCDMRSQCTFFFYEEGPLEAPQKR